MSQVFISVLLFLLTATGHPSLIEASNSKAQPFFLLAFQEKKVLSLPVENGAWLVRLDTGGGFSGGTTSLMINSTGEALLEAGTTYRCLKAINAVERSGLAKFMASVETIAWNHVTGDERGQSDMIRFDLTLIRRKGNSQRQYNATFYQKRKVNVPDKLLSLVAELGRLQKLILERCR